MHDSAINDGQVHTWIKIDAESLYTEHMFRTRPVHGNEANIGQLSINVDLK